MWNNSQLSCHFDQIMQKIQRKGCRNICVGKNNKFPGVYTWCYVLQCILNAELWTWWKYPPHLCTWWKQPLQTLTKNNFIIYFDHNCRTAFFQNTSLRSKRVGMNLTHHTVSSTFLTLKCHSLFFFLIRKERKTGLK